MFLRRDRRGRTASFAEYINILVDRGLVERVHVGGAFTHVFARNVNSPMIKHDTTHQSAAEVLDQLIAEESPILLIENTVDPWMRELNAEIDQRQEPALLMKEPDPDQLTGFIWLVPSSIKAPDAVQSTD